MGSLEAGCKMQSHPGHSGCDIAIGGSVNSLAKMGAVDWNAMLLRNTSLVSGCSARGRNGGE